jgi:hypothetical protein
MDTWKHGEMETLGMETSNRKRKEAQVIFRNPFTVRYLYKWKFVVFWFVDKETNGSHTFANRLNRLAHLL